MVPQPNARLQHMGSIINENFSILIMLTLFHGAFILLFCISIRLLLQRGIGSHSTQAMLSLAAISFTSATVGWAAAIAHMTTQIRSAMIDNMEVPLDERLVLSNLEAFKSGIVTEWAHDLLPAISDSVVVWRAWVLFFEHRWVMIGPLVLLLGTYATSLTSDILDLNFDTYIASSHKNKNLPSKFYHASLALSLATNALATIIVGYKLWSHRRSLNVMLSHDRYFTRAQNVLLILIESGLVYFTFLLTGLVTELIPPAPDTALETTAYVFQAICAELSGMYPLIVIVLVNYQCSFVDTCGFTSSTETPNTSEQPVTLGHQTFATPAKTTSTESLESQNAAGKDDADTDVAVALQNIDMDV